MFKTISFLVVFILFSSAIIAQKSVNSYKYILIPKQYEFQKKQDAYQVNSLTKFLFKRAGFVAFFNDENLPEELAKNMCLALKAVVNNRPSFLNTKMNIDLVDCRNVVVFSTKEARSKEKEYKKAYHEALRKSFVDIEALNYVYDATSNNKEEPAIIKEVTTEAKKESIPLIKTEKAKPKSEKNEGIVAEMKKEKALVMKKEDPPRVKEKGEKKSLKVKEALKKKPEMTVRNIPLNGKTIKTLEGKFEMGKWGECFITKEENGFALIGGTEKFKFASIYKTSKTSFYIIKWVSDKQPQLLELTGQGDLKVDTVKGVEIYKRLD